MIPDAEVVALVGPWLDAFLRDIRAGAAWMPRFQSATFELKAPRVFRPWRLRVFSIPGSCGVAVHQAGDTSPSSVWRNGASRSGALWGQFGAADRGCLIGAALRALLGMRSQTEMSIFSRRGQFRVARHLAATVVSHLTDASTAEAFHLAGSARSRPTQPHPPPAHTPALRATIKDEKPGVNQE